MDIKVFDAIQYESLPITTDTQKSAVVESRNQQMDVYEPSQNGNPFFTYTMHGEIKEEGVTPLLENKSTSAELPKRYAFLKQCYMYYQGELISEYDFMCIAVETGAIELDETQSAGYNEKKAWEALIYSKAKPLFDWSTTLYSEDRMYIFRVENGMITGLTLNKTMDGTDMSLQDIANQIASGKRMCDLECDTFWLMSLDRELYDAARSIGMARSRYIQSTELYNRGQLTHEQYLHDIYPLFLLMIGKNADIHDTSLLNKLQDFFEQDEKTFFEQAFKTYKPENQRLVYDLIVENGYHAYSGIY